MFEDKFTQCGHHMDKFVDKVMKSECLTKNLKK